MKLKRAVFLLLSIVIIILVFTANLKRDNRKQNDTSMRQWFYELGGVSNHEKRRCNAEFLGNVQHNSSLDYFKIKKRTRAFDRITLFNDTGDNMKAECVPLQVPEVGVDTNIFIYDTSDDIHVSRGLKQSGFWEKENLQNIGLGLRRHPDAIFLDVGSHVGTFSMVALALGHKVIAIDALKSNLQLLSKSVRLANKQNDIVMIWNAVSNVYEDVRLKFEKKNVGSTHIVRDGEKGLNGSISAADYTVKTIFLDDIAELFDLKNKTIFMKIDIEGSEHVAVLGASKLFEMNNVCYILMELMNSRPKILPIVQNMQRYGLHLFTDAKLTKNIDASPLSVGNDGYFGKDTCRP